MSVPQDRVARIQELLRKDTRSFWAERMYRAWAGDVCHLLAKKFGSTTPSSIYWSMVVAEALFSSCCDSRYRGDTYGRWRTSYSRVGGIIYVFFGICLSKATYISNMKGPTPTSQRQRFAWPNPNQPRLLWLWYVEIKLTFTFSFDESRNNREKISSVLVNVIDRFSCVRLKKSRIALPKRERESAYTS